MDIKVREVSAEEKSSQEIEQELLDKHEEKQQSETGQKTTEVKVEEPQENVEVKEESIPEDAPVEEVKVEEPPKRKAGIKVASVEELVQKLKNEAKVI